MICAAITPGLKPRVVSPRRSRAGWERSSCHRPSFLHMAATATCPPCIVRPLAGTISTRRFESLIVWFGMAALLTATQGKGSRVSTLFSPFVHAPRRIVRIRVDHGVQLRLLSGLERFRIKLQHLQRAVIHFG